MMFYMPNLRDQAKGNCDPPRCELKFCQGQPIDHTNVILFKELDP
jgi:hypothetical protein